MLKHILIIAAALFLVGGIVFFIAFAASGFSFGALSPMDVEDKIYTESADNQITSISVNYSNADVEVSLGETFKVSYPVIVYKGGDAISEVSVTDTSGKLVIRERIDSMKILGYNEISPKISITVPRDRVCDFSIEIDNGTITLEGSGLSVGNLILDTDNGDLNLNELSAVKITASTDGGFVTLKNATAAASIDLETDRGEIQMFGNITSKRLEAETSTGDISHENGIISADKINISTEVGDIEATLAGSEADYTILVEKSLGTSNVSNSVGGAKRAELGTEVGDIEIRFQG